jgi:hypothetical protein
VCTVNLSRRSIVRPLSELAFSLILLSSLGSGYYVPLKMEMEEVFAVMCEQGR